MPSSYTLSSKAGRISQSLNGKSFAVIGGRSEPSLEDKSRGKLLFEAKCLADFATTPVKAVPYSEHFTMPSKWENILKDCEYSDNNDPRFNNWGDKFNCCSYWGLSLKKWGEWTALYGPV